MSGDAVRQRDPSRDRDREPADEKPRRRGSRPSGTAGGGSKKSTSRKSSSRAAAPAGAGGERVREHGSDGPRRESEGLAASPDLTLAQDKGSARPTEAGPSRTRPGAKGVRRRAGGTDHDGGQFNVALGEERHQRARRGQPVAERALGAGGVGVDRAILQNMQWHWVDVDMLPTPQVPPDMEVEDEDCGGGYDDECFEEYSDEFDGDGEDEDPPPPVGKVTAAAVTRPGSARGEGGRAVVSPALKMRRPGDDIQAPDDKVLEELRDSLREENIVATERKVARPSAEHSEAATADAKSSSDGKAVRGAKGAKGSRSAAAAAATGAGVEARAAVAKGKFSVDASADVKRSREGSGFKMADAKALTRALAKERVRAIRRVSRLEVESVRLFDQAPILPIDLYHRRLRGQSALIRQAGTQTNDDARSVEGQTDEIVHSHKEVQFHLGHDDTALENLMRRLRSNRRPPERHQAKGEEGGQTQQRTVADGGEHVPANEPGSATTTFKGIYNGNGMVAGTDPGEQEYPASRHGTDFDGSGGRVSSAGGSDTLPPPLRLGKFLRQASVVMETLCEENLLHAPGKRWGGSHPLDPARGEDEDAVGRERGALFSGAGGREGEGWEEVGAEGGVFGAGAGGATAAATDYTGSSTAEEKRRQRGDEDRVGGRGARALLEGSEVVGVEFSKVKRSMLVTAHARPVGRWRRSEAGGGGGGGGGADEREAVLEGCGVVCVWNTDNVQGPPVSVLCGEGLFSCLCLARHQAHVVITGTEEGCLLLWDLREPSSEGRGAESRQLGLHCGIRAPTYITAGGDSRGEDRALSEAGYGHSSKIVSVVAIPSPTGGVGMDGGGGGIGGMISLGDACSFQVASLDDRGTVFIWLASEVPSGDEGGSQTDLGLSPGGRVRLAISKALRPGDQPFLAAAVRAGGGGGAVPVSTPRFSTSTRNRLDKITDTTASSAAAGSARALAFSPEDPNRFLIGDSSDRVIHASRLGKPPPPRAYGPPRRPGERRLDGSGGGAGEEQEGAMGGVTCLAFSPFFPKYFLAGCGDGSVRLYNDASVVPLTTWEAGSTAAADSRRNGSSSSSWPAAISSLAWSEHRPAVFFALDFLGVVHAFDLLEDDAGPLASEGCPHASAGAMERSTSPTNPPAAVAEDASSSSLALPILALSSETLATGRRPKVALAFGGSVFAKTLAGRMFRRSRSPPVAGGVERSEAGILEASERERMKEWLGEVLWA
ncbi:unnamed protein product [Ectocarpus sp. CCAP 1310/34]|nr:unnamed protein product [Ectocarpus sp. CCAP 1310/34]